MKFSNVLKKDSSVLRAASVVRSRIFFSILFLAIAALLYFLIKPHHPMHAAGLLPNKACPFCTSSILDHQKFYEDDLVIALYTHKPVLPGHCLIIPKRHLERFELLSDPECAQICQTIKKVDQAVRKVFGTSAYLILQKNGREVGQSVPHIHFHYIPRKANDDSTLAFLFRMFWADAKNPIAPSEMNEVVEALQKAINSL